MDPVQAANLATPGGDLSMLGLFMSADLVVKFVILLLLAASIWVWAMRRRAGKRSHGSSGSASQAPRNASTSILTRSRAVCASVS